ncbi:hypothetical protein F4779DRAFT_588041 [Xylariaceae sp. FL0662B]|nr:hypothetical protein F4779DRAFT_588041 [Xylariaceae sp. FL0662B]
MTQAGDFLTKWDVSKSKDGGRHRIRTSIGNGKRRLYRAKKTIQEWVNNGSICSGMRSGKFGHGVTANVSSKDVAERMDSALHDILERPSSGSSYPLSTMPSISVGSQTSNVSSPASSISDITNENQPPGPHEPVAKKRQRRTFPLSKKDERMCHSQIQSLDKVILDMINPGIMRTNRPEDAAKRDSQSATQQQPVPDDFKLTDDTRRQELREEIRPDRMALQLQVLRVQKQTESNPVQDSKQFVKTWELELLPKLEQILDDSVRGEYSVNVRRGQQPGHRIIDIMTAEVVPDYARKSLWESKDSLLSDDLRSRTSIEIRIGEIEYLADRPVNRTSSQSSEDHWHPPINTCRYSNPVMGDSTGPQQGGSGTIGPLLQIAQKFYRLLNWHIFDDKGVQRHWDRPIPPSLSTFHPSLDDAPDLSSPIGKTVAYSGRMYQTTRISNSISNVIPHARESNTVTDWVLVETTTPPQVNRVRKITLDERCDSFSDNITVIAEPKSSPTCLPQEVYSTGRSSGYTIGQICEVLGEFKIHSGVKARNWSIESTQFPDEDWNLGGMGVPGDSGAAVIDKATNKLLGQIWGRNRYKGDLKYPRVTYFTAVSDIYDDIRERMPGCEQPVLPTDRSIASEVNRRPTLASISEDGGVQPAPQPESNESQSSARSSSLPVLGMIEHARSTGTSSSAPRRSAARTSIRLSGCGDLPGFNSVRRWVMIAHAATF